MIGFVLTGVIVRWCCTLGFMKRLGRVGCVQTWTVALAVCLIPVVTGCSWTVQKRLSNAKAPSQKPDCGGSTAPSADIIVAFPTWVLLGAVITGRDTRGEEDPVAVEILASIAALPLAILYTASAMSGQRKADTCTRAREEYRRQLNPLAKTRETRKPNAWFSLGLGGYGAAGAFSVQVRRWRLAIHIADLMTPGAEESDEDADSIRVVGMTMGGSLVSRHFIALLGAGPSMRAGDSAGASWKTGLALEATFLWLPGTHVGLGLSVLGHADPDQTSVTPLVSLHVGRLRAP